MTDEQQVQPPIAEAPPAVDAKAAPAQSPKPWITPDKPEDQPFCEWLDAISEGKNPFKTQDKSILREYSRLTLIRRAQQENNRKLREADQALQRAVEARNQLQARSQQIQGSLAERLETLREFYLEQAGAPAANRATRRANASPKAQKIKAKAGKRAAS